MEFNPFALIIIVALVTDYALNRISEFLNLRHITETIPEEFRDVYDGERYQKSQEYLKTNTRFGIISSSFSLVFLFLFWWAGGFVYLDRLIESFLPGRWARNTIVAGLCYFGTLMVLKSLLSLPFSIYSTFVIEERFGFNKTTVKTFITDILKGLSLAIIIGGPLMAAILAIFEHGGRHAWLYCWAVAATFSLLLQFIAPRWILPLFNKFTPLEDGELKQAIEDYAEEVNFPLEGVYVMDGSKRSTKSNAFLAGFGKNKKIALFDTLIEKHTVPELLVVLAHEIGHHKKKHIHKSIALSILHMGLLFYLLSLFLNSATLYEAFGFSGSHMPIYAGFVFFGLLYSPIELVLSILFNAFSRHNEREADAFAVETTGRPEEFADALKKLSRDNLSNLTPHPFTVFLHYSHPPVLRRVRAMRSMAGER